jgi:hypothetical protein
MSISVKMRHQLFQRAKPKPGKSIRKETLWIVLAWTALLVAASITCLIILKDWPFRSLK